MVETYLLPLGPTLVEACGITAGMRVLDVAAGTANASIPAAKTGADVTASDLTPELFDAGRRPQKRKAQNSRGSRRMRRICRSRTSPTTL
jgi:SAM-dependent methyltransferase